MHRLRTNTFMCRLKLGYHFSYRMDCHYAAVACLFVMVTAVISNPRYALRYNFIGIMMSSVVGVAATHCWYLRDGNIISYFVVCIIKHLQHTSLGALFQTIWFSYVLSKQLVCYVLPGIQIYSLIL